MMSLNNSNYEENLLLSLPAALAMTGGGMMGGGDNNESFIPITTQNYTEKYRDLEKLNDDLKKNNDELKRLYKSLKTDHTRLKTECLELKTQMTNLIEENKIMQEKYKSMFEKMQQESRRKQIIIEELKNRELDDVKLDRIKEELSQQIEGPYKDIVRQLEQELQKLQEELNKQKQEAKFVKTNKEHDKNEHNNFIDQLKMKHEVELNTLRKDRDILREKLQENNQMEINRIKEVIRENNQLRIKVKSLIEENDELREKLEHTETQNNSLVRNHSKSLSDFTTKISVLESEKESLKQQVDNSYKETVNLNETLANNIRKLHDLERENTSIKLSFDEVQHNCKKDVSNLKLEMVKEKGDHNRAKEALNNQIEDLKLKVEIANENVQMQKRLIDEKERELAKTMNGINEENWTKINDLTNDKIELESKVQILSKEYEFKIGAIQLEKDKSDDRLKAFEKQREEIIKENNKLRAIIGDSDGLRLELEKEQEKNRDFAKKMHKIETELASNTSLEQELTEINMKLKNELSFTSHEIHKLKEQLKRSKDDYENQLNSMRSLHLAEKNDYQFKFEDLQIKYDRANSKINDVKKFHEKKKKQYQTYAKAIKTKAEALNMKVKELKIKEKNMKNLVPLEEYNRLKMQLKTLANKHQAFSNTILNPIGAMFNSNPSSINANIIASSMNLNNRQNQNFYEEVPDYIEPNFNDKITQLNVEINNNSLLNPVKSPKKSSLNFKFDEIANRLDQLTTSQNENLKQLHTDASEKETNIYASPFSQLKNSSNGLRSALADILTIESNRNKMNSVTPPKSVKSQQSPEKSYQTPKNQKIPDSDEPFDPFAFSSKQRSEQSQIERKKLSLSSTSSSSMSELSSKKIEKKSISSGLNKSKENATASPSPAKKNLMNQKVEKKLDFSSSYEEDFNRSSSSDE